MHQYVAKIDLKESINNFDYPVLFYAKLKKNAKSPFHAALRHSENIKQANKQILCLVYWWQSLARILKSENA